MNQAPIALGCGRIGTEGLHHATGKAHRERPCIVAVEHLLSAGDENTLLRRCIIVDTRIAIEMILGDVKHGRRDRPQARRGFQLEARQFEHEHVRPRRAVLMLRERIEDRLADVANDRGAETGGPDKLAGQRRHRALSVRAGDCQHPLTRRQSAGKELDVADQFDTTRDRGLDRGQRLGNARTDNHQIGTGKGVVGEWSLEDRHPGELGGERPRARRIRTRVGDRDMRATTRGPARRRQTREPKT